jgi:hypothetical protein
VRTAYVNARTKQIVQGRRYCQLLDEIAREQTKRHLARPARSEVASTNGYAPDVVPFPTGLGWQPIWTFTGPAGSSGGHTHTGLPIRAGAMPDPKPPKPQMSKMLKNADWNWARRGAA